MGVKALVYEAVARATLLYGVETWVLRAADLRRLAVFDRGRVRWVAGVRGRRLGGAELEMRTGLKRLEGVVVERRWRWLGHVLRLPESRWPRRVLEWSGGEEEGAVRRQGAPKLGWVRQVVWEGWSGICWQRLDIAKPHWLHWKKGKWCEILRGLAVDRALWRCVSASVVIASVAIDGPFGLGY